MFIPDNGRLSLIRNPDSAHLRRGRLRLLQYFTYYRQHRGPYLIRVMLDPTGLRKKQGKFALRDSNRMCVTVK